MKVLMGNVDGRPFEVDPEALRRSHLLITGVSGSGKSYRLRVLAEMLTSILPVWVFDVEGEYFTLREKFPFLLFGENGDAPMAVETAGALARKMLTWKHSAIFDLSSLEVEQQHEWMREFLNSLMSAPRELWGPLACLIDEAHLWAPEKGEGFSVALNATQNLCSRGRKRGFFVCLATQRLSKLANNCASEMQNYLVGRTTLPSDRDRAAKMLGVTMKADKEAFFRDIKTLRDHYFFGQGIAISPDRIKLAPVEAKTTHVRPGDIKAIAPATPAEIQAFLPQLSTLKKEAQELHDQATGGAELAKLRAQLAEAVRVRDLALNAYDSNLDEIAKALDLSRHCLTLLRQEATGAYQGDIKTLSPVIDRGGARVLNVQVFKSGKEVGELLTPRNGAHFEPAPEEVTNPLERYQGKLVTALCAAERAGVSSLNRTWLAIIARVSPTSSAYRRAVSQCLQAALMEIPQTGLVSLTDKGREVANPAPAITTETLMNALDTVFEPARFRILRVLAGANGKWVNKEKLAELSDQSANSSAYRGHLADLRGLGLIELDNQNYRIDPFVFLRPEVRA